MKIIYGPKNIGKTKQLISMSAENGAYIVCVDKDRVKYIMSFAYKLGLIVPFPITFDEFINKRFYGKGIKKILMDDADDFIRYVSTGVDVEAITLTSDDF